MAGLIDTEKERFTLPQWLGRFALGTLRSFIDEGVESPGIADALKSRKTAFLKFVITVTQGVLPRKPDLSQLEIVPPFFGELGDVLYVENPDDIKGGADRSLKFIFWLAEYLQFNDVSGLANLTKLQLPDP